MVNSNENTDIPKDENTNTENINTESTQVDPVKENDKVLLDKDIDIENPHMPANRYDKVREYIDKLESLSDEDFEKIMTVTDALSIFINSKDAVNNLNRVYKTDDDLKNNIKANGKEQNIRDLPLNFGDSEEDIFKMLKTTSGVNTPTMVPLWHSGFWVTIGAIESEDIIWLERTLTDNHITLGMDTVGQIFSNYDVVFNRIVSEFIVSKIINHSIKVKNKMDLLNYIRIQDLQILALGLLRSIHYNGTEFTRECAMSTILDKDKRPKCNAIFKSKIDLNKMLYLDTDFISNLPEYDFVIDIMSRKMQASVSTDDVVKYQSVIKVNDQKDIVLEINNSIKAVLKLEPPILSDYIRLGEKWLETIEIKTKKVFTSEKTNKEREEELNKIFKANILGIHNSYVKSIEIENRGAITKRDLIDKTLSEILSVKLDIVDKVISSINEFKNDSTLALVGMPTYICDKCKTDQNLNNDVKESMNKIIPINVMHTFLDLVVFWNRRMINQIKE